MVAPITEDEQYRQFIKSTFEHLATSLSVDGGEKRRKVASVLNDDVLGRRTATPQEIVMQGRFALGADDASYLQTGLATLWSTACGARSPTTGGKACNALVLAPPGLYKPNSVDGIRNGILNSFVDEARSAPKSISNGMNALDALMDVQAYKDAAVSALGTGATYDDVKALMQAAKDVEAPSFDNAQREKLLQLLKAMLDLTKSSSITGLLVQQLQEQEAENAALREEKSRLERLKHAALNRLAQFRIEVQGLEESLREERRKAEARCSGLSNRLKDCERLFSAARIRIGELEQAALQADDESKALLKELEEANGELESLGLKEAKYVEDVLKKQAEIEELHSKLKRVADDLRDAESRLDDSGENAVSLQSEVRELRVELSDTQTLLEALKSDHQETLAEYDACKQRHEALAKNCREENAKLLQKLKNGENALADCTKELESFEAQIGQVKKEVADRDEAHAKQMASMWAENNEIANEHWRAVEGLKQECGRAVKELKDAHLQGIREKDQMIEDMDAEITRLTLEIEGLKTTSLEDETRNKKERDACDAKTLELTTRANDLNTALQNCMAEVETEKRRSAKCMEQQMESIKSLLDRMKASNLDQFDRENTIAEWQSKSDELKRKTLELVAVKEELDEITYELRNPPSVGPSYDPSLTEEDIRANRVKSEEIALKIQELKGEIEALNIDITQLTWQRELFKFVDAEKRVEELQSMYDACSKSRYALVSEINNLAEQEKQRLTDANRGVGPSAPDWLKEAQERLALEREEERRRAAEAKQFLDAEAARRLIDASKNAQGRSDSQGEAGPAAASSSSPGDPSASKDPASSTSGDGALVPQVDSDAQASDGGSISSNPLVALRKGAQQVNDDINLENQVSGGGRVTPDGRQTPQSPTSPVVLSSGGRTTPTPLPTPTPPYLGAAIDYPSYAIRRGLCGQRGPLQAAGDGEWFAHDALLPYELPSPTRLAALAPQLGALCDAPLTANEEQRLSKVLEESPADDPTDAAAAVALLKRNFAVITSTTPVEANDARDGVEEAHQARWLPTGAHGRAMATVATLEHAAARCSAVAIDPDTPRPQAALLTRAAASLKMHQMQALYALREAQAYAVDTACAPLTEATADAHRYVTRPCAVVRNRLSFPTDAGLAAVPTTHSATGSTEAEVRLKRALERNAAPTHALRNRLRMVARGEIADVYVAPSPDDLGYRAAPAAPTGVEPPAASGSGLDAGGVDEAVSAVHYSTETWMRLLSRLIVHTSLLGIDVEDAAGSLEESHLAEDRREGIWNEFQRNVAISGDRLWVFVRLLSGVIGGEVNEIVVLASEQAQQAAKDQRQQRIEVSKRVSDAQSKIVQAIVNGVVRDSRLTLAKNGAGEMVVIDAAARDTLRDLERGESGRPFFEANVALRALRDGDAEKRPTLTEVLGGLHDVGVQLQQSLEQTLVAHTSVSSSLDELSSPANSYFVNLKPDVVAAIRTSFEMLNVEMGARHLGRRLGLWELVEGGCNVLTTRFAELVGYVITRSRASTGVSSMYVSQVSMVTHTHQARAALEKLVTAAALYVRRVDPPDHATVNGRTKALNQGEGVTPIVVGRAISAPVVGRQPLHAPVSQWGWWNVGGRTR